MTKDSKRMTRINDEIEREVATVIRAELADPRIGAIVSVMRAETTTDLKMCRIEVSVLGSEKQRGDTLLALQGAAGFIRKRVAETINLRATPEIKFVLDDSIERGFHMSKLIDEVNKGNRV